MGTLKNLFTARFDAVVARGVYAETRPFIRVELFRCPAAIFPEHSRPSGRSR
jgi:hypothetical protein